VRILYTNNTLSQAAGTELAVRDLCLEMRRRGHEVAAFSVQHGRVAAQLREAGVPVAACPAEVPFEPEVIHGHHEWETSLAALHWPHCPVISFCRGLEGWQEEPCVAPNVVRWVAIDEPCRQRLLDTPGVVAEKVRLVLNGIDLERFQAGQMGRERVDKALILSNYATEQNFAAVVVEGCRLAGLDCQILGAGVGRSVAEPERVLAEHTVVFAKGKVALEALACGCAVVVCDERGLGPLVTPENFEQLRAESFGFPCMTEAVTVEGVVSRLAERDAQRTMRVCAMTRQAAGAERMFDDLERLYAEVQGEVVEPTARAVAAFAAVFLARKGAFYKLGKEVWSHGAGLDLICKEPMSGEESEIGINRMLDRLRRGIDSMVALKEIQKREKKQVGEVSKWRFWQGK
jgi:hypothetical protein